MYQAPCERGSVQLKKALLGPKRLVEDTVYHVIYGELISKEEVLWALNEVKKNAAPGSDG